MRICHCRKSRSQQGESYDIPESTTCTIFNYLPEVAATTAVDGGSSVSTGQPEVEADVHDEVESQREEEGSSEFSKPVQDPTLLYAHEHHKVNDNHITLTMLAVDDSRYNGVMVGFEIYVVGQRKENILEVRKEVVPGVAEFVPVHTQDKSGPGGTVLADGDVSSIAPDELGHSVRVETVTEFGANIFESGEPVDYVTGPDRQISGPVEDGGLQLIPHEDQQHPALRRDVHAQPRHQEEHGVLLADGYGHHLLGAVPAEVVLGQTVQQFVTVSKQKEVQDEDNQVLQITVLYVHGGCIKLRQVLDTAINFLHDDVTLRQVLNS
jgi:hypothetical protein